jgi:very-short-patch-repair endonuclease
MTHRRDRLRVVAARQGGVFTAADAERAGISRGRLRTLVARGEWVRLRRPALAERLVVELCDRDTRSRHALEVAAAQLAMRAPAAAVKGSAAAVWQLDLLRPLPPRPLLVLPSGWRVGGRTEPVVRMLRAGPPDWRIVTVGGVRTTDLARTVVDLARTWPLAEALVVADGALRYFGSGLLAQMYDVAARCAHWPGGGARVLGVLRLADPRAESVLETLGRLRMHDDGLPRPQTQCWVGEFGPEFRADFGYAEHRTLGEADGRVKYTDADVLWQQAKREERLHDLGFEVVRFDNDATTRPGELGARFRRAFDRAQPGRGRFWPDPSWWSPGMRRAVEPPAGLDIPWWLWDPGEPRLEWAVG